ncbi:MAG: carboxypeptidase-like regulatory domain-containing protein [Planctomycetes bacterium]|nr:carboxypeptidase-like regulatory domain-containing protein [Planctomycetota bacterium]
MQGDGWTRTLDDGSFAFRDLGAAKFALHLKDRGWELAEPKKVYDPATEGTVDVLVRPKAGLSVSGRVLREDGKPFPIGEAPRVIAMPDGTDDLDRWRHAECRPDGSFTLENLEDGEHVIMVRSGQPVFEERRVAAGVADLLIQPAKPRKLSGRVLDAAGQPVSGCEVRAVPPGKGPLPTRSPNSRREVRWPVSYEVCRTGADGGFRFERLVGEQVAIWAFHVDHPLAGETLATDGDGVELRLPPGRTLSGVLLDAERRPLGDHQVIVAGSDKMVRHAKTDAQGAFAVRGLPEGECAVSVMSERGRLVLETTLPAATEGTELRLPAR